MQGISSSDEDAFDDDASAYSSSGNDSDIVRAISADIVMDGESNRCLGSGAIPARRRAPHLVSVVDVKRDNGCKCLIGDCIDNFGRGEVLLTRTINGGLDNMSYGLSALNISTGPLALRTFQTAGPVRASTLYLSLALQDHRVKCRASRLKITVARSMTNFATFSCILFLKFRYVCIA